MKSSKPLVLGDGSLVGSRRGSSSSRVISKNLMSSLLIVLVMLCLIVVSLSMVLVHVQESLSSQQSFQMPGTSRRVLSYNEQPNEQRPSMTQVMAQEEPILFPAEDGSSASLREQYPPSIWTVAERKSDPAISNHIASKQLLNVTEQERGMRLCGKFLYSTIQRAVQVGDMGEQTFVATGDIDSMWTRDSVSSIFLLFAVAMMFLIHKRMWICVCVRF